MRPRSVLWDLKDGFCGCCQKAKELPRSTVRNGVSLYLQDVSQHGLGIYWIRIVAVPVLFLGDLGIQDGTVLTDIFPFLLSDLCHAVDTAFALGIVENIEVDGTAFALSLLKDTVFLFRAHSDTCVMLCNPAQHIGTLSDVHDFIVNLNAVDSSVFILVCKPFAFQPFISIVCVITHQNTKSSSSFSLGFWNITAPESFRLFIPGLSVEYVLFISISTDGWV